MSTCVNPATVQPTGLTIEGVRARMAAVQPRIEELWRRYPTRRAVLLQVLHLIQGEFGWVPRIAIEWAAEVSGCSPAHAFSVVEFYTMYRQAPMGRHLIQVCQTMCCHIQGTEPLIEHLEHKLGIHVGGTTEDGLFSLVRAECLALCGTGPGVMIDDQAIGPKPHVLGEGALREAHLDYGDFHPGAAHLDTWIDFLRAEAGRTGWSKDQLAATYNEGSAPAFQLHCAVGKPVLDTKGHPQGFGSTGKALGADYFPPAPALNVRAAVTGGAIALTWANDPGTAKVVVERSLDGGTTWKELASVGPRDQKAADVLAEGVTAQYRVIAHEKTRSARPSVVVSATGAPAPAPAPATAPAPKA